MLRKIENVFNSNEEFLLGVNITIRVDITYPCRGQGRRRNDKYLPLTDYLQKDVLNVDNAFDCLRERWH